MSDARTALTMLRTTSEFEVREVAEPDLEDFKVFSNGDKGDLAWDYTRTICAINLKAEV